MNCDICNLPAEPSQGLYGGRGNGDKTGARIGSLRHYQCHIDKYGHPYSGTITQAFDQLRQAVDRRQLATLATMSSPVRKPKVTKGEYNRSPNAIREFRTFDRITEMGRTRVEIECPFCFNRFWVFVWSISGGGKKCTNCGAMHASFGQAFPIVGNEDI